MVITNAIYLDALWKSEFEETRQAEFIISASENKTVQVDMMTQEGHFNYYEDEFLQLVEMPYRGDKMSMLVLLPKNADGLPDLEDSLTAENLSRWKNGFHAKIILGIPKFSLDAEYNLADILHEMGIRDAFDEHSANFSKIYGGHPPLYIDRTVHKAFVDVTEKGTKAGAATGISMRVESAPHATFYANHPFVFIIQDVETENILFIGRLANPGA